MATLLGLSPVLPAGATEERAGVDVRAFTDVPADHPFRAEIDWMRDADISGGFPGGTYRPAAPVTRQAMAAFMHRLADLSGGTPGPIAPVTFSDVPDDHPFADDIEWMAGTGISEGFADGTFRPGEPVTRQAMAAFMHRLSDLLDAEAVSGRAFSDVPTSHPFFSDITWMDETGISEGFSDGTFRPPDPVTRQAMSAFMFRLFDLVTGGACGTQTDLSLGECTALVALWTATNGSTWTDDDGWLGATSPCTWYGVECIEAPVDAPSPSTVQNVFLGNNNLTGELPTQVDALANARTLNLTNNDIAGEVPVDINNMVKLVNLTLDRNELVGALPDGFDNMLLLEEVRLGNNHLTGPIPASLGAAPALEDLIMPVNEFSGSLPASLGDASALTTVNLALNQLTGDIPAGIAGIETLERLFLFDNALTGSIPTGFGSLTGLTNLHLERNNLTGPIPADLVNATALGSLLLADNDLSGAVPVGLEDIVGLSVSLAGNGCLTSADPDLTVWLDTADAAWDDGCP